MWETWVRSLGWEDPLEKGKAIHSSILAWRIPWGCKELDTTDPLSLSVMVALAAFTPKLARCLPSLSPFFESMGRFYFPAFFDVRLGLCA